ncbi:GumC family protein [Flavobacterium nitratireducens]|uniref:GumC family protein n=1 Tax=Flavobacterium nitratireducens TaxID=992289 RepID=UPI002415849C|nr:tyrosine-protein kinase [Flavobacterium nitratireducens]
MENYISKESQEQEFHLRAELDKYLVHWKWFVLVVLVAVLIAFVYLRYAVPQYQVSTTILVKDEKKGGGLSELSAFADMGITTGLKNNLDNEVEILKSRTLVESTIQKLHLNVTLVSEGKIKSTVIYKKRPIVVTLGRQTQDLLQDTFVFQFESLSTDTFTLKNLVEDQEDPLQGKEQFHYGRAIETLFGELTINKTAFLSNAEKLKLNVIIAPLQSATEDFRGRLKVTPLSKTSSVVELAMVSPVVEREEDFLNTLVQNYNENAVQDKNIISEHTSEFIAERLNLITKELAGVEQDVESFKRSNKLTDIPSEAALFIEGSDEYNKKIAEVDIQLQVVANMLDFMKKSRNADLLPVNLISDTNASGLINSYNQLVLERNRILKSATESNPAVIKLDEQISALKASVSSSLGRLQSSLNIQKRKLDAHEGMIASKIQKIPTQERQFRIIDRQQKVKEQLYLYLLQKREETAISLASTEANARVIDAAMGSKKPVSPKKAIIYLAALLLGLLIPFGIIYLMDLFDTKIKSRLDLEGKTQIPFIGDVPTSEDASSIMQSESRSSSAEALRIIRTNLEFMLAKVPEGIAKTIFLTSTFPKEGKTFVSVNLAATFALSGKKVLLIGMDIRNPRLDEYLTLPDRGVTNYLSSKELSLEDLIIQQKGYEDFHVLPAGVIPPNPAELLMSKKVDVLFETLKKQYDYIIVDTAPVSLVTDTLLIAKHADTFIYVARANFLEKRMLDIPNGLHKDQKLPNMCMLLNDTDSTKGYGYGYGYGVKVEKTPWYKKIFKI